LASTSSAAALLNQALELHRAGRLDDAGAIYEQLLTDGPEHADAAHLLGLVRFRNNDVESAIHLIGDALARDPENPVYHANLGNVLKDCGRMTEAIAAYRRALTLRPTYAEVENNLGYALQTTGMIDDAIGHYRSAIALRPSDHRARFNLGNALFLLGKAEAAIVAYRGAVSLSPGFASGVGPPRDRAAAARPARRRRGELPAVARDRTAVGGRESCARSRAPAARLSTRSVRLLRARPRAAA
jgi:tetratricopeptide (TPR) repeat protein